MEKLLLILKDYWHYIPIGIGGIILIFWVRSFFTKKNVVTTYLTTGATLTKEQAKAYAERLYHCMDAVGTDNPELERIRTLLAPNPYDLRLVYNEFGLRKYLGWGAPSNIITGAFASNHDLKGWLKSDLSSFQWKLWETLFIAAQII